MPWQYHIYYSNDYNASFIQKLNAYFNHNQFAHTQKFEAACDWIGKLKEMKVDMRVKREIVKLWDYDNNISTAILDGNGYDLRITLEKLYTLVPKHDKKRAKYNKLSDALSLFKVNLIIE